MKRVDVIKQFWERFKQMIDAVNDLSAAYRKRYAVADAERPPPTLRLPVEQEDSGGWAATASCPTLRLPVEQEHSGAAGQAATDTQRNRLQRLRLTGKRCSHKNHHQICPAGEAGAQPWQAGTMWVQVPTSKRLPAMAAPIGSEFQ